jgi:ribonucleoside-diphosphate reductase alpha chain
VLKCDLEKAAKLVKEENERVANIIGINKSARTTTVKPSGTSSLVLGTSSGIHAWHDAYYIRRIRVGKNEAIYTYLQIYHPELVEDDFFKPTIQAIISVPQKAPDGAILRSESALDLLERVKLFNTKWIKKGHRSGANTNNVSATVSVKNDEWGAVGKWMWENKNTFNGLSVLPEDLGSYVQTPYETCDEATFLKMSEALTGIDLAKIVEITDNTNLMYQQACAAGNCEIV